MEDDVIDDTLPMIEEQMTNIDGGVSSLEGGCVFFGVSLCLWDCVFFLVVCAVVCGLCVAPIP